MLISDSKKFIFVHIPKTAGSSLTALLKPYALPRNPSKVASVLRAVGLPRDYRKFRFPTHCGLLTAEKVMPAERFAEYFKFAFVRNPWDRLVSEFNAIMRKPQHRRYPRLKRLGFKGYLTHEAPRIAPNQFDLICSSSDSIGVDFIGRFEKLAADVHHVCDRLGIECTLGHVNGHPHEHYSTFYDDDSREFVKLHWAKDIEAFGYEF